MWTFFEDGTFYSCVVDWEDEKQRIVRSRDKRSALLFADFVGGDAGVVELKKRDYAYRVFTDEQTWERFLQHKASTMKATNFKTAVAVKMGPRHPFMDALHDIWSVMWDYQAKQR
jgi:hypothetical protein